MAKVLFYTDTPIFGGAERHMQLLAKHLQKRNHQIKVACSASKSLDPWCESLQKENIEVIRIHAFHKHDPRHFFNLRKILRQENPDILHIHVWNPAACKYAFFTKTGNMKLIATEHDPFPLTGIKKFIKKRTLRKVDYLITVSKNNEQKMLEWYPELENKISTVLNGIDLEEFEKTFVHFTQQEKTKIRTQIFKANPKDKVIISIAALHPRKGLPFLIDAFHEVHQRNPETKLIIVGKGPQKEELEKQIKERNLQESAMILEEVESVPKILKSSDLFVLASVKEAFGLVLLEAMAAGIPIIATNVGGIPEIIEDQKNGILVESKDNKQLAKMIIYLLDNSPLGQKLIFLGHHRVKDFSAEKMAEKTEEIYRKVLKSKD